MIVEILRSCPLLENFDGYQVFARDIVNQNCAGHTSYGRDSSGSNRGQKDDGGWICYGMQLLDLHFTGFSGDSSIDSPWQWKVFSQIARLENLRYLSIGGRISSRSWETPTTIGTIEASNGPDGLDLRLNSGLGQLCTLKKLRMLRFTGIRQKMTESDVRWMIENLPELRIVQGVLHTDLVEQQKLETIFESHGINVWSLINNPMASLQ
jgi:hypothetical protein